MGENLLMHKRWKLFFWRCYWQGNNLFNAEYQGLLVTKGRSTMRTLKRILTTA